MADKIPLKLGTIAGSTVDALKEFAAGETIAIAHGGTGATTASAALTALGGEASANKNASGGYPGLSGYKHQLINDAGTFTSTLANTNTAARAYTLPDVSGEIGVEQTGTFSPSFTCATPGDLSYTPSAQIGRYRRSGTRISGFIYLSGTLTYTTATGAIRVTGFPVTAANVTNGFQSISGYIARWTRTNYNGISVFMAPNSTYAIANLVNGGQSASPALITDFTTGTVVEVLLAFNYEAA